MKNILHIITSPRKELSASRKLGNAVIEKIQENILMLLLKSVTLQKLLLPF